MVFKWNDQHTLLFLENYKNYECLWNHKIDDYKNKIIRTKAIKSLINDLNLAITPQDVKLKIKSIRTRFTTELAKIKQSMESGCSADDVYVPTLYWFKHAEFLTSVCFPRQNTSRFDASLTQNEDSAESEHTQVGCEEQETKSKINRNGNSRIITPSNSQKSTNTKRKIGLPIYRAIQELKTISQQAKDQTEDEFDLFCKSLAVQLKKMPLNRALICQQKLQSVMTEERLTQMSQSLPEQIYLDSSASSTFSTYQPVDPISKYEQGE